MAEYQRIFLKLSGEALAGEKKNGCVYPLHHPEVTFDEEALPVGSAILAYTALKQGKQENV